MDRYELAMGLIQEGYRLLSAIDAEEQQVSPARLERIADARWEKGAGTFEGVETRIIGRERRSGQTAMLMRLNQKSPDEEPHFHTGGSHSVVLDGEISFGTDEGRITLTKGDYFYCPARFVHNDSGGDGTIFSFVDPAFDTVLADERFLGKIMPTLGQ